MEEVFGVVYLIQNQINGKRYVGKTTQTLEQRMKKHQYGNLCVDKAIEKYGIENFRYGVIKTCATEAELNAAERHFIAVLKTKAPYGYNLTDGGDGGTGCKHTPETCAKISAALTGKPKSSEHRAKLSAASATHTGEKASFYGRNHTEESKAKMRAAKIGKHPTDETRAKMSATRTGKKKSPETCAKLSIARRGEKNPRYGKKNTPEHQAKIVASRLGKKTPPETCAKISAALTGKPFTIERCANISVAKRAYSPYKNLLAELEERSLSYAALARLLGLSPGKVSMKMRCERNFTERDKANLVEIFGKPIEYLLARDDDTNCENVPAPKRNSPYKNLIAELFARQMTYTALAELLGLSYSPGCARMRGEIPFNDSDKAKLVEIFGKSIEYLLARDE